MKYEFSSSLLAPPAPEQTSDSLQSNQQRSFQILLITLCVITPLIVLALYAREGSSALTITVGSLIPTLLVLLLLQRTRWAALVPPLVAFGVLFTSIGTVVVDGTVHSAGVLVMLASVVGGGSYSSQRTTVALASIAVVALGILNVAEGQGWLPPPRLLSDGALWLTQTGVLICLLVAVFYSRKRLELAYSSQQNTLKRWEQVAGALRASEARFMGLFRSNPAAVLVQAEESGLVLDVNEAFERMFGFTLADMTGHAPPPLWLGDADQSVLQASFHTHGRVQGKRVRALRCDGQAFDALVYAEFVKQGQERLIITMVLDVSAEEAGRRALEKSEERFARAFNFSPLGMSIVTMADGRFLEVNPAYERVLGYSRPDLIGSTAIEAGLWAAPADRDAYIGQLRRDGRLAGYETRLRSKQGGLVDVKIWSERIEIDNKPCNLAFTLNVDEEKRREAMLMRVAKGVSGETGEAFFRSLVEQLAQAIGASGVMIGEIREGGQLDTLALVCDGQQLPNTRLPLADTPFEEALAQTGLFVTRSDLDQRLHLCPMVQPAGLHSFAGVALRDHDGTAIGLLGALWRENLELTPDKHALMTIFSSRCNAELVRLRRDREIRKLHDTLEQRVADRTAQLELLNRELDTFAYSVSHDLKSPLRSIDGFMHLLREQMHGRMTAEDEMLMSRVMASATRMNNLISDLLALARVSQTRLQPRQVNLSELAEQVVRLEKQRDPDRNVEVRIAPDLMVHCDARMAHIVLENLLGNAWKYSRHQALARIEFDRLPGTGSEAPVFVVRDNGAGFDMARRDRLFKPFSRLHAANEFEGSGIGLATVRRILERHGGQINGTGDVGRGATFEFHFGRPAHD